MKINLLPTYVSKEKSAKAAWFLSIVIAAASIVAAVFLRVSAQSELDQAKEGIEALQGQHAEAVRTSKEADTIISEALQIIVNIDLAQAMMKHNDTYPQLYGDVRKYIPRFFRVTSMAATPNGPGSCTVTLTGVLSTYQEYADLMLALLRIPDAQSVSRDGYQLTDQYVPALTPEDQTARPIRPGESNIPDDPMRRLEFFLTRGRAEGFTGTGGFGTDDTGARGAMPDWSLVTVSVLLNRIIQTPDPRATLAGARGGGTAPAGGMPGPGSMGGGPPMAPGGPPPGARPESDVGG